MEKRSLTKPIEIIHSFTDSSRPWATMSKIILEHWYKLLRPSLRAELSCCSHDGQCWKGFWYVFKMSPRVYWSIKSLGDGVTHGCESPDLGAGNWTRAANIFFFHNKTVGVEQQTCLITEPTLKPWSHNSSPKINAWFCFCFCFVVSVLGIFCLFVSFCLLLSFSSRNFYKIGKWALL